MMGKSYIVRPELTMAFVPGLGRVRGGQIIKGQYDHLLGTVFLEYEEDPVVEAPVMEVAKPDPVVTKLSLDRTVRDSEVSVKDSALERAIEDREVFASAVKEAVKDLENQGIKPAVQNPLENESFTKKKKGK